MIDRQVSHFILFLNREAGNYKIKKVTSSNLPFFLGRSSGQNLFFFPFCPFLLFLGRSRGRNSFFFPFFHSYFSLVEAVAEIFFFSPFSILTFSLVESMFSFFFLNLTFFLDRKLFFFRFFLKSFFYKSPPQAFILNKLKGKILLQNEFFKKPCCGCA